MAGDACTATKCDAYVTFTYIGFNGGEADYHVYAATGVPGRPEFNSAPSGTGCTITECNEYVPFSYYGGHTPFKAAIQAIGSTPSWAGDHVTKTVTYSFADGSTIMSAPAIIEPTVSTAPTLTQAIYPADWTTGGVVQKPSVTAASGTYGDSAPYSADGSAAKPFRQATLTPNGATGTGAINDPSAFVVAPTKGTYDLTWGTPDPAGPGYATNFNQGKSPYTLPASTKIFGSVLSANNSGCLNAAANVSGCGATLPAPSSDIIDAWNKGWTGKGQNILIVDDIGASPISPHAATVETIAQRYAWGATFYGMTNGIKVPTPYNVNVVNLDGTPSQPNSSIPLSAINMSWGADLATAIGRSNSQSNPWTQGELTTQRSNYQNRYSLVSSLLNSSAYMGPDNLSVGSFNPSVAVIAKSAGNDSIDAQYEPLNFWLSQDSGILSRLLIVGALTGIGTTSDPVSLASYSNTAGINTTIQERFLVESGVSPFGSVADAYNGVALTSGNGTSYAAPRVAAYAAIVHQKFPNLTAPNTADILLATARYDTLTCYPNCDKSVYGQGEASLSRALAPVGYLR